MVTTDSLAVDLEERNSSAETQVNTSYRTSAPRTARMPSSSIDDRDRGVHDCPIDGPTYLTGLVNWLPLPLSRSVSRRLYIGGEPITLGART